MHDDYRTKLGAMFKSSTKSTECSVRTFQFLVGLTGFALGSSRFCLGAEEIKHLPKLRDKFAAQPIAGNVKLLTPGLQTTPANPALGIHSKFTPLYYQWAQVEGTRARTHFRCRMWYWTPERGPIALYRMYPST